MGGSSLCPEVVSVVWRGAGGLRLHVLDNTNPAAVAAVDATIAGKQDACSSSPRSRAAPSRSRRSSATSGSRRWQKSGGDIAAAGASFVAITDPATRLGQLAEEKHYRRVFINPADIGGRYSALSFFGLVPAALLGADVGALLAGGGGVRGSLGPGGARRRRARRPGAGRRAGRRRARRGATSSRW